MWDKCYECEVWENGSYLHSSMHWADSKKLAAKYAMAKARDYGHGADGFLSVVVFRVKDNHLFRQTDIEAVA